MGPIRVNLSTSGVGLSVGVRGARVGVGPRGTYVSLAAGGFQYRRKLDNVAARGSAPRPPPGGSWGSPTPAPATHPIDGFIATASVESLQQTSPDALASEIQQCSERADWFKAYWVSGVIVLLVALPALEGWAILLLAVLLAGVAFPVHRWNAERRTARLIYDVDDPAAMERFALASAAGEALAQCAGLWHVYSSTSTSDARRNAGATTLLRRTPTRCAHGVLSNVETNLEPWSITAGPQQLMFLPDRLFVREGGRVAAIPYEYLSAHGAETRFVEEGPVPPDGQTLATTWRYVCKDGTPDLRFRDNYQLPVLRYGELTLHSPHGVRIVFQLSRADAVLRAAHAINTLSAIARGAQHAPSPAPRASVPMVTPTLSEALAPAAGPASPPAAYLPSQRHPATAPAPAPVARPAPSMPARSSGTIPMPVVREPAAPSRRADTPPTPIFSHGSQAATPVTPAAGVRGYGPGVSPVTPALVPDRAIAPAAPILAGAPPRSSNRSENWVPAGGAISVAGFQLPGGMLYVGDALSPVRGLRDVEPALINPRLPVDRANPNRRGEGMSYWPSYSEITPAARAAYLEWLAGGRSDPNAYIGYVFLFFYGLERRLLSDARRTTISAAERDAIFAEVTRLLGIYGHNRSFRTYATDFLGAAWVGADGRVYERAAPPLDSSGSELPLLLRLGLGQLVRDGRPIPARWALSWVLCDPTINWPTPVRRCPEEFRELFGIRYARAFGDGLSLKPGGKDLSIRYRPASASFGGELALTAPGVPDVTAKKRSAVKLHEIAEQCASELDAFSRWVGRHPDERGSLAAIGFLPPELIATHQGAEIVALCRTVERHLGGNAVALVPAAEIVQGKRAKAEMVALAQLLQKKGYGIEPDVRFGGELPDREGKVAVFRVPDDAPTTASAHYKAATLLVHVAVAMAAADGHVSDAEVRQIDAQLRAMESLAASERTRLLARAHLLAQEPPGLAGLKKRIETLDARQKSAVADLIVAMAGADGQIDPAEVKLLVKLFPMLGLEQGEVYRRIHALAGAQAATAGEPVTVKPAEARRGFKIPPPPAAEANGIALDMAVVQAKLAETSAVAALLGAIFVEEAPAPASATPPGDGAQTAERAPGRPAGPPVRGLDAAHSALVWKLAERSTWSRAEVEGLAAGLGLLTDGALELVNETAFDVCGSAVWSGDDPVEIDGDVMKELCS